MITTAGMIEARGHAEGRAEMLLQLIARRWAPPSRQTRATIKGGTDREFRVWSAAIFKEESLDAFLAAPDNPDYENE